MPAPPRRTPQPRARKDGAILAEDPPCEVVDRDMITAAYGLACEVVPDPVSGTPMVVPRVRHHAAPAAGDGSPVAAPQD